MTWLKKRLDEPSTYNALALLIGGVGILTKMKEAPEIAQAVEASGTYFSTGDYLAGGLFLITSLAGFFMKEKARG